MLCVQGRTSDGFTPRRHFPEHQGHGVNVSLLEGLHVLQVQSGLQHLRGHVAGRSHLRHRGSCTRWTRTGGNRWTFQRLWSASVLQQPKQLISFTQTTVSKGQVTRETIHNPWNWSGSSAVHFKRCRTPNIDVLIFWNLKQNKKQQQCTIFTRFYTDLAVYNVYHIMHKLELFYYFIRMW